MIFSILPVKNISPIHRIGLIGLISFAGLSGCIFALTAHASTLILPPNNTGLVGYWPMNEGQGATTVDKSGSGNTATLINGPTWIDGKFGRAVEFNSASSSIALPSVSVPAVSTVSLWIYINGNQPNYYGALVAQDYGTGFWLNGDYVVLWNGSNNPNNTQLTRSIWHHVVLVAVSGTTTFYLDGQPDGTAPVGAGYSANYIGNDNGDEVFNGKIDDVRIYSRALSAQEISRMYQQGSAKRASLNTTGLVAYYPMNENSGPTIYNKNGQGGLSGTLASGAAWTTGKYKSGVVFNANDSFVSLGAPSAFNNLSAFSYNVWLRIDGYPENGGGRIFDKGTGDDNSGPYMMYDANGGDFIAAKVDFDTTDAYSKVSIGTGAWHQITTTYSDIDKTIRIYVDGAEGSYGAQTAGVGTRTDDTANNLILGTSPFLSRTFNGVLDDLRIYNRVLPLAEIAKLYSDTSVLRSAKINTSNAGVSNGLVGWWTFDGPDMTNTTSTDRSGNHNDGTIIGSARPVSGKRGQALSFRNSEYGTIPVAASTYPFSVSIWFKTTDTNATQVLWSENNAADEFGHYFRIFQQSGVVYVGVAEGGTSQQTDASDSASAIVNNTWYNASVVFASSTSRKIYINGRQDSNVGTTNVTPASINTSHFGAWGGDNFIDNRMKGVLDDLRVYNRALSASEVLQLYNAGK